MRYDTGRPRVVIRFRCAVLRCAPALRVTLARLAAAQSALMAEQDLSAILTAVPGGRSEQPSRPKQTRKGRATDTRSERINRERLARIRAERAGMGGVT